MSEKSSDREIVITRTFDAKPEVLFDAWTVQKHLAHWWGPKGFKTTFLEFDVRPGGIWRFLMHDPEDIDYNNRIVFIEVMKPERLVYDHGSDEEPDQFRVTVTFAGQSGGKTLLTMRLLFPTAEECRKSKKFGAVEGGNSTLDRLQNYLLHGNS